MKKYITLKDLEVYQLARELSRLAWEVYEKLDWHDKKIIGDQFIKSTDSVGAITYFYLFQCISIYFYFYYLLFVLSYDG